MFETLETRVVLATLAWFPLDEVAGTVAADVSGNGNDGTLTGGAWAGGQIGGAIEFNVDGNISVPSSTFATVNQEVTFAFWAFGGDTQPVDNSVLYGVNASGDRVFNVHLPFSNGRVYWDAGESNGYDRINKVADPLVYKDSWHHWAFTKNAATGDMKIYLDGALWHSGTGKTRSMSGVSSFTFGAHTNGSSGYDGLLDDVRIYDTELSATEIMGVFGNTEEVLATNVTLSANANSTTVIASANLETTDAEQTASQLTYTLNSLPNSGSVLLGSTVLQQGDTFTQDDINNSLVSYSHNGQSIVDLFTFAVDDGIGSSTSGTFDILVATSGTVNSLAGLRTLGLMANNASISLSTTGGDPHPVTGVVTPGTYWINGDHIDDPTNSPPIFMNLAGTGNTYDLTGTTIKVDTRKLDGFGRNLGHDSGVDIIQVNGSNNLVKGINLIGEDIALDTDPNAQRYADWSTQYVELSGDDNTIDGVNVVTRGSRTDAYGLGDAFGKGSSGGIQPFLAHRKANAFRVGEATNAMINDMHLDVNTFGHGFFVQASTNTTLTNSTVTGELFPSTNVINHPLYQQYGFTYHQNQIPDDILISGNEGGVRMYTGSSGLTVDNVVVTNMRTGFATSLGGGTKILNNVEAYGVESAFGTGNNTTITNAKADGINGPILVFDRSDIVNTSVEIELVGSQPFNHDYALVYANGNNVDISITSARPAEDFEDTTVFRAAQFFYDNWRETNGTTTFDVANYDHINSVLNNNTNMTLVLGDQASGNTGSSQGFVIANGKQNDYDGISLVPAGKHTVLEHSAGLGNNGTAADGSLETNASVVQDGGTLEVQPGIRITDEKLTITGDGVDGNGALYSDGSADSNTRFGSSNGTDESTIFLDGDASIGVGVAGNQLLAGRIQGVGDLTKLGAGILTIGKSSALDGNMIVAEGHITARSNVVRRDLTVAAGASISAIGNNSFNTQGNVDLDGTLDLNGRTGNFISVLSGKIGRLNGSGQIISTNTENPASGATLTFDGDGDDGLFTGSIDGVVELVKSGTNTQALAGSLTHTGVTAINDGVLQIDGSHTGGGDYTINAGGTLGGNGSLDSAVIVNASGRLSPGASAGVLSVGDATLLSGAFFDVELGGTAVGSEYDQLTADTVILGGDLSVSLLMSTGGIYQPSPTDSFTVLVSSSSLFGAFGNVVSGGRVQTVGGEGTFLVTYGGASNSVVLSDFEVADLDFGDAPTTYSTLMVDNGARHVAVGPRLGSSRDSEVDGITSSGADADGTDEDGALFGGIGVNSSLAAVNIELSGASDAKVDAWIDFNRDGVWDLSEKIIDDLLVDQSMQTINYSLPTGLTSGDTYARVRVSSAGGLSPTGLASDGEVEDYLVSIIEPPTVESIVVNDGDSQRSSIDSIQLTFDDVVEVDSVGGDPFQLVHVDSGDVVTDVPLIDHSSGKTVVNFTFDPAGLRVTNSGSLENGDYELTIDASRVTQLGVELDGNGDGANGDDYVMSAVDGLFRKYGDQNGNGLVDLVDFSAFRQTFGKSAGDSGYLSEFDSEGDDLIGLLDFAAFRQGFGT